MSFNHYAKIKRILADYPNWYILKIDQPTRAKRFNGETVIYEHYYRVFSAEGEPIKFCKFQQLELFAKTLSIDVENLPIVTTS